MVRICFKCEHVLRNVENVSFHTLIYISVTYAYFHNPKRVEVLIQEDTSVWTLVKPHRVGVNLFVT